MDTEKMPALLPLVNPETQAFEACTITRCQQRGTKRTRALYQAKGYSDVTVLSHKTYGYEVRAYLGSGPTLTEEERRQQEVAAEAARKEKDAAPLMPELAVPDTAPAIRVPSPSPTSKPSPSPTRKPRR
jgi:hypothetical protein